jgi:hypothetical protein
MGWFHRLLAGVVAPDIESLKTELAQVTRERDWYQGRCLEIGTAKKQVETKLSAEIKRNRSREDELVNQIISLGGGRTLPIRDKEKVALPQPADDDELTQEQDDLLRQRAVERCPQLHPPGTEITSEMIDSVYEDMKTNPKYWLDD